MSDAFCEGFTKDTCEGCPKTGTQHPCHYAKVLYWRNVHPIQLARSAAPTRWRALHGRKELAPGDPGPPPAGYSEGSIALDHAIPTDERGLPYLGADLEPLTRKEMSNRKAEISETLRRRANTPVQDRQ